MTTTLSQSEIADAFQAACEAELQALKPGNVHVFAPGHDMDISHFRDAARAAAPHIAAQDLSIGARVHGAVNASLDAAKCNTNLGIILLCAPLAAAAQDVQTTRDLRTSLAARLSDLTQTDAGLVFAAIRLANPGGLGDVKKGDVNDPPSGLSLIDAMALAGGHDRIAHAYVSGFADLFTHHLPTLQAACRNTDGGQRRPPPAHDPRVVTTLYMRLLAEFPDSHIFRKFGGADAHTVQAAAEALRPHWWPVFDPDRSHGQLLKFDTDLKEKGLNPGTTADFVVATLFARALLDRLPQPKV